MCQDQRVEEMYSLGSAARDIYKMIVADAEAGRLYSRGGDVAVASFSRLHDFCDANMYIYRTPIGALSDRVDELVQAAGVNASCVLVSAVFEMVDMMLRHDPIILRGKPVQVRTS